MTQRSTTGIQRHLVTVAGTRIEYLVAGQGPDVVLLHGLGESADDWRAVMTHLSPSYRLYAPTLPGYGSDTVHGPPNQQGSDGVQDSSPESFARFCAAFIDTKELHRPVLVGHSLGGLTALFTALDRPERLRGLVLIAAAGLGRTVTPALQAATLPFLGDVAASLSRWRPGAALRAASKAPIVFGRPWRIPPAWLSDQYRRAQDGRFMQTSLRSLRTQVGIGGQRRIVLDDLSALSLPTLVVWGTADRVVPASHGHAAVARLPAGRMEVLTGLGHIPHVEDPGRVAATLRGFLDSAP